MACRTPSTLALLFVTLVPACGPGADETTAGTSSSTITTSDPTTGQATTSTTTGQTSEQTTGQTSQTSQTSQTTAATTDQTTDATTDQTTDQTTDATTNQTSDATTEQTTDATTGEAACPDEFPEEGTPCTNEGQFCNSGCESPCQFCNIMHCENGIWQRLEAPPAQCLDCESVCEFVVAAGCAGGPPDQAACVAGCMNTMASDCAIAFDKMLACIGPEPTFSCDAAARPTVVGCDANFDELYMCMGI